MTAHTHAPPDTSPTTMELDVTVVLPCRNEATTVATCVHLAHAWIASRGLSGEVVVVDNDSTDNSATNAHHAGARIVHQPRLGYGNALRAGIDAAHGRVVIMADADNTYDLTNLDDFYDPIALSHTADIVIGDRFSHPLDPAAMNRLHRAGNRILSALTRLVTGSKIRDFHCGLRSFTRTTMTDLPAWSTGMEYATHMLTHAHTKHLRIDQTPITLHAPTPGRRSHLNPARDGLRHLTAIAHAAVALRSSALSSWRTRPMVRVPRNRSSCQRP